MKKNLSEYLFNKENDPNFIFSTLTYSEQSLLNEKSVSQIVRKGQVIFHEGEYPKGLIYLTRGSVKLYMVGAGGREQIVRLVKPLSFVGYKALFAEKPHTSNAEAILDSEILIYEKETLFSIIDKNSRFSREIIKALANELGFNYNRLINLTQKDIRGRLAETLLLIKDIYGFESDGRTLSLTFTRVNLAHFSNMTTSNAIRTLKSFKIEGLIQTLGKKIILLNIPELKVISKME